MAVPTSLGSGRARPEFNLISHSMPSWAHPEVVYWYETWRMIRDCCEGEKAVKAGRGLYLPQLEGMDGDEYAAYLDRATFYNFTGRTASALTGSIFRRLPTFEGIPPVLIPRMERISRAQETFQIYAEHVADEVTKLGRHGVLVDLPSGESTSPNPYLVSYPAETILDVETAEINGRDELVRVVLWELKLVRDSHSFAPKYISQFRVLKLEHTPSGWVYMQELYSNPTESISSLTEKDRTNHFIPINRGKSLNFIPFHIFGSFRSTVTIEKPPLEDIARLNISHYNSYANLEHGRLFCGFPMYFVEAPHAGEGESEFTLGASRVWVTPPGARPGILELNGQGLKFLENALDQKEQQASAMGGRMMGVRTTAVAESDNMLRLAERNEQSQLLKITRSLDVGFTRILRWWALLQDVSPAQVDKITCAFNKDFLFDGIGAREFRAIHAMYKDGIVPIDVVYHYLKKGNIIPDWMDLEEFRTLLDKMDSFPNNPDAQARADGYTNSQARQQEQENKLSRESDMELLEVELEFKEDEAALARAESIKARREAAKQPKMVPGQPGQQPGQPGVRPPPKPPATKK